MDLLTNRGHGGVLQLDQLENLNDPNSRSVREILMSKHPTGQPALPESILKGSPEEPHPIMYENIDGWLIRSISLKVNGADHLGWMLMPGEDYVQHSSLHRMTCVKL